jgi:hypothetical protein
MTMVTLLTGMAQARARTSARNTPTQNTADRSSYAMLQLCRSNLEVRLQSIDEEALSAQQGKIYCKIADMLRAPAQDMQTGAEFTWDEIYKLERLIALLFTGPQLRQEITRRLAELADQNVQGADCFRREYESLAGPARDGQPPAADDGALRAFLLRVIEALQWAAKKKYLASPIRKQATKKILFGVLGAFTLMIAPYLLLSLNYSLHPTGDFVSPWWSHLTFYTAVISGGLGAFFSRLIVLQRNLPTMSLEEVVSANEWSYASLRAGVGMCGALLLFYFFVAGLIEGTMFPHVEKFAIDLLEAPSVVKMSFATPSKDLALLTVWCFMAGFSELLVPGLLAKAERQFLQPGAAAGAVPAR